MKLEITKLDIQKLNDLVAELTNEELENLRRTVTIGSPDYELSLTVGYPFREEFVHVIEQTWKATDWFTVNFLRYKYSGNNRVFKFKSIQHNGTSILVGKDDTIHQKGIGENDSTCLCEGKAFTKKIEIKTDGIFEWTKRIVKSGKFVD